MARDLKYGNVPISKTKIPVDEPIFILRAQDKLSEPIIRMYAEMVRLHTGDTEIYRTALISADNFNRWPKKKIPD